MILALIMLLAASPALAAVDRFTDDRGTLHITNIDKEKPRIEERDEDLSPAPGRAPRTPDSIEPSQEVQEPEPPEIQEMEEGVKPSSYLTVRKGVIHITNVVDRQMGLAQARPVAPGPGAAGLAP